MSLIHFLLRWWSPILWVTVAQAISEFTNVTQSINNDLLVAASSQNNPAVLKRAYRFPEH